jgi:hypothetical protein
LPRFAAAAIEHGRHQADEILLHAAVGGGLHLDGALLFDLVAQEADVVSFPFHASAWACALAREDADQPTMAGAAQFRVNFWCRGNTGVDARV